MQEVRNIALYQFSPAGFRLSLILPGALSVSHSPIDPLDPSDKVVYGQTIFLPMATHFEPTIIKNKNVTVHGKTYVNDLGKCSLKSFVDRRLEFLSVRQNVLIKRSQARSDR